MLLKGALEAETKVGLKMNIARKKSGEAAAEFARAAQSDDLQSEPERLGRRGDDH